MLRMVCKLVFFCVAIIATAALNQYLVNGPLLQSNIELSLKQFSGIPSTAGDVKLFGYWISFCNLYLVEVGIFALLGVVLFVDEIVRILNGSSN